MTNEQSHKVHLSPEDQERLRELRGAKASPQRTQAHTDAGRDAGRAAHLMSGQQEAVTGVRDTVTAPNCSTVSIRKDGTDGPPNRLSGC